MRHKLPFTSRYCCKCRNTTRWELEQRIDGEVYRCVGDDVRHPERRMHGCGTEVRALAFLAVCAVVEKK